MKNFNKKQKIIIVIVLIIISIIYYIYKTNEEDNIQVSMNQVAESEDEKRNKNETEANGETIENSGSTIIIHITGAIKKEGVYELKEGDRIIDAINKADGVTEEADTSKMNLAAKLEDGMKIYIPKKGENIENIENIINNQSIQENSKTEANSNNNISSKKININKASLEELDTLPGIGETTAQKIIEYRKENGEFSNIEELKEVSGIGDRKFEEIKDKICV